MASKKRDFSAAFHSQEHLVIEKIEDLQYNGARVFKVSFTPDGNIVVVRGGKVELLVPVLLRGGDTVDCTQETPSTAPGETPSTAPEETRFHEQRYTWVCQSPVRAISTSQNFIAVATGGEEVYLLCPKSLNLLRTLKISGWNVISIDSLRDGTQIAFGCAFSARSGKFGGQVLVWDTAEDRVTYNTRQHGSDVVTIAFSPDGKFLASGSSDGTIHVHRSIHRGFAPFHTIGNDGVVENGVMSVAFSLDSQTLAASRYNCQIMLWKFEEGVPSNRRVVTTRETVESIRFLPNTSYPSYLVSASRSMDIELCDTSEEEPRQRVIVEGHTRYNSKCKCSHGKYRSEYMSNPECSEKGHSNWLSHVACAPGEIVTCGLDSAVKIWSVKMAARE